MASNTPQRQMSLIPYPTESWEVVLRRGNSVVLYDPDSQQLTVRNASDHTLDLTECPFCHQPWPGQSSGHDSPDDRGRSTSSPAERPFVDPGYFAKLAASQRPSPSGTGASTPPRPIFQHALRSGRSRDVSGSVEPPAGAEFVGSAPALSATEGISKSAFSPGYFDQFFIEKHELGRGGNGVVLLVEHVMDRVSLGVFACKRIPVGNDHSWLEKVLIEVKLLQGILHPNLVQYRWTWLEDYQPSKFGPKIPCLWILQDYCNTGDLHSYIIGPKEDSDRPEILKEKMRRRSKGEAELPKDLNARSKLTFDEIFSFFRDITSGLHCLHSKGYIHRDLKPSNCLLHRDKNSAIKVLISDFGEVQVAGTRRGSTGATGTISYCAPEVLQQESPDGVFGEFTTKSDIFSLGMIVFFMCFGRLPYVSTDGIDEHNEDMDKLRAEITNWSGFDDQTRDRQDLPEKLYKFLKRLLSVDPNERPSTGDILNSIRGGVPLEDPGFGFSDDSTPRVSSLDSPAQRGSPSGRRPSGFLTRPGLSSVGRHNSGEQVRPTSPLKRRGSSQNHGHSTPTSPIDGSVVVRPRKIDLPGPEVDEEDDGPPSPQSPRLMLPPPPERPITGKILRIMRQPATTHSFRALIFTVKLLSLSLPCSPYAANTWLLYPLMCLAALDIGVLKFDLRRSILLLATHLAFVLVASQHDRLCQGKVMVWEEEIP